MIDSEIIARQARVIEELKEQVSILKRCLDNEERPVKHLGQKTGPIGYIAFGGNPSGDLFPFTQYTGKTEQEVGDKIMAVARAEGWIKGTVAERLEYLGWVILPVYMKED